MGISFFCWTHTKEEFLKNCLTKQLLVAIDSIVFFGSQWLPTNVWLPTFFKISSFVLNGRKKLMRVRKWQNLNFWVNYPFKSYWPQKQMFSFRELNKCKVFPYLTVGHFQMQPAWVAVVWLSTHLWHGVFEPEGAVLKGSWLDGTLSAEVRLEELEATSNYNRIRLNRRVWGSAKLTSYIFAAIFISTTGVLCSFVVSNKPNAAVL